MEDKILFESEWHKIGKTPDGYEFVWFTPGITILPFRNKPAGPHDDNPPREYLLRKEYCPLYDYFITCISGRKDKEDGDKDGWWFTTAERELEEEAGIKIQGDHNRFVSLGKVYFGKSARNAEIILMVDVTGLVEGEAKGDGGEEEKKASNFWVGEHDLLKNVAKIEDAGALAIAAKFLSYLKLKWI